MSSCVRCGEDLQTERPLCVWCEGGERPLDLPCFWCAGVGYPTLQVFDQDGAPIPCARCGGGGYESKVMQKLFEIRTAEPW